MLLTSSHGQLAQQCASVTFAVDFRCIPVTDSWSSRLAGRCINFPVFFLSAVLNGLADFFVVVMPMPIIWKLPQPMSERNGVSLSFFLGGVVVARVFRLTTLYNVDTNDLSCKYSRIDVYGG